MPDTSDAAALTRTCPYCDKKHPDTVDVCSCGHKFAGPRRDTSLGTIGMVLAVIGICMSLWGAFVYETSIGLYERVQNIGLLQRQMMLFEGGLAATMVGALLFAAERVLAELHSLKA
jgi:hypothetical protein